MKKLKENRFYRDEALNSKNIVTVFETFGWKENRDWLGRDDDLTFIKGPSRVSFNLHPNSGYDFVYYKDFEPNEYSADYMIYSGRNLKELENDVRDFDNLKDTDFLKYKAPQLFDIEGHALPILESRKRTQMKKLKERVMTAEEADFHEGDYYKNRYGWVIVIEELDGDYVHIQQYLDTEPERLTRGQISIPRLYDHINNCHFTKLKNINEAKKLKESYVTDAEREAAMNKARDYHNALMMADLRDVDIEMERYVSNQPDERAWYYTIMNGSLDSFIDRRVGEDGPNWRQYLTESKKSLKEAKREMLLKRLEGLDRDSLPPAMFFSYLSKYAKERSYEYHDFKNWKVKDWEDFLNSSEGRNLKEATAKGYKILSTKDIQQLKYGLSISDEDDYETWDEIVENLFKKYVKDPDELAWIEEQPYSPSIKAIDDLIDFELKNHHVYDITSGTEEDAEAFYLVQDKNYNNLRGIRKNGIKGILWFDTQDEAIEYAESHPEVYFVQECFGNDLCDYSEGGYVWRRK